MDLRFIYAAILSILPISELRGGLIYASLNGLNPLISFFICTAANILVIFLIFFFLDKIHNLFTGIRIYKNFFDRYLERFQKKLDRFEKKYSAVGFLALTLLVALPLPIVGGAWTGCLIAWLLDLGRKRSIVAIIFGVIISGLLVSLGTLGFLRLFS